MILFRWSYDYCTGADFGGLLSLYANGNAVEVYYLAWFYFIVHMLSVAWSKSVLGVIYVMAFWFFIFIFLKPTYGFLIWNGWLWTLRMYNEAKPKRKWEQFNRQIT